MATRRAWVLNLDADVELGAGAGYTPSRRVKEAMRPHVERLAATLVGPDDLVVDDTSRPLSARGLPGVAFCPTPRAIALLVRAGAEPEPHPSVNILRRVNARAFATSLGATLPGAAFVTDVEAALATVRSASPLGDAWRVKQSFGMAGRNQRVISGIDAEDVAFLARGCRDGGVQIEPNVAIEAEYALHGVVEQDGSLLAGYLVRQRCDARGAWASTERIAAGDPSCALVRARMHEELAHVAEALHGASYFGPFGIDAFVYRGTDGERALQPRSEINARYSMGFAVGFGPPR
jgi:hypothetical protein